jgi:hypothetical protein
MKYTWLVEKYLEGELSGEALRKFELEILRNPEVANEVERVRSMTYFMQEQHNKLQDSISLIEDYDDIENVVTEEEIRKDLDGLKVRKISDDHKDIIDFRTKLTESGISHTLLKQQSSKILVKRASVWLAAACLAVLIVTSFLLLVDNNGPVDHIAVYEQFYTVPYADVPERSLSGESDDPYALALEKYNRAEFNKAFVLFNSIPKHSVRNDSYYLYKGVTAMELENFQIAIESFDELEDDPILKHYGMWYKGLCYLWMEDLTTARKVFKEIIGTNGHYKKSAKSLLKSI